MNKLLFIDKTPRKELGRIDNVRGYYAQVRFSKLSVLVNLAGFTVILAEFLNSEMKKF